MVKTQHRPGTPLDIVTAPAPPPWAAALVAVAGALAVLEVMHLVVGAAAITLLRGSKVRRAQR